MGLLLAEISRGKRDTNNVGTFKLDPLFDAIASVDLADCGKLLVCHVVAKNESDLTVEEHRIVKLFKSFTAKLIPFTLKPNTCLPLNPDLSRNPKFAKFN